MKTKQMQDLLNVNCMDYAKYVITDRAIIDIRDGLKPIHRRIIWSFYNDGLLYNKNRTKSANACSSVLKYSPHGDSSVYQAAVRLANDSVNINLVDGKGSFGTVTSRDIQPGAMRYCVTGDTLVSTTKGLIKIKDIVKDSEINSDNDINIQVYSMNNKINSASKFFNCGEHDTYKVITECGYEIEGTSNHPLLTIQYDKENNILKHEWKLIEDITEDDYIVFKGDTNEVQESLATIEEARFLGGMISEGYISKSDVTTKVGFGNSNLDFVNDMRKCFKLIFNEEVYTYNCPTKNHEKYEEINVFSREARNKIIEEYGFKFGSRNKEIPYQIFQSSKDIQSEFLRYLFEGDGGISLTIDKSKGKDVKTGEIFYSSSSIKLIKQIQTMLFNTFDIVSCIGKDRDEFRLEICEKDAILKFRQDIGFAYKDKQKRLDELCNRKIKMNSKYSNSKKGEYIPYVTHYIKRNKRKAKNGTRPIPKSISTLERLKEYYKDFKDYLPSEHLQIVDEIMRNEYRYFKVRKKEYTGKNNVYSIRVDNDCHSFIANGMINHNTEMRLSPITQELIKDIDKGIVDMVDNYDSSRKEPVVLPVGLPMALINPNLGIAVGLASNICGYDLKEVCQNAAKVMLKEEPFIMYPEFSTGEYIINNQDMFKQIHNIGRGTIRLRAKYKVENDSIVITNIPYTSTRESIIESVIDLVKSGTIKEVIDINDNSGIKGFDITIDIKKNTNIEMLMEKLYKLTPLENTFSANFTVLHEGKPKVLGVKDILKYWCEFRIETMQRTLDYNINKLNSELMLMKGLSEILINLDECIKIIRNAESDEECIQSLMNKYNLNKIQAEYISNIKLRNLNKSSIQKQLLKIKNLEEKLKYSIELRNNENDIRRLLAEELISLGNKYSKPRKSELLDITDSNQIEDILIEDYNLNIVLSKEGYMKKVRLTSLRGASEYKFKDGDTLLSVRQTSNKNDLLIFTDKQNCYKLKIHEIQDHKPSVLGLYLPSHLQLEEDEHIIDVIPTDYTEEILIAYVNGKVARVPLSSYKTKTNRTKLSNATHTERIAGIHIYEDTKYILATIDNKALIFNAKDIPLKSSRNTQGITVMKHSNMQDVNRFKKVSDCTLDTQNRYIGGKAGKPIIGIDNI